eukprot:1137707-Pelagomonas_calceolata.AAC.1
MSNVSVLFVPTMNVLTIREALKFDSPGKWILLEAWQARQTDPSLKSTSPITHQPSFIANHLQHF